MPRTWNWRYFSYDYEDSFMGAREVKRRKEKERKERKIKERKIKKKRNSNTNTPDFYVS
jgi:hypothetical protein